MYSIIDLTDKSPPEQMLKKKAENTIECINSSYNSGSGSGSLDSDIAYVSQVDPDADKENFTSVNAKTTAGNSEVELVGTRGDDVSTWPHARDCCIKFPIQKKHGLPVASATEWKKTCEKCMCFVCETFVEKCVNWEYHCRAFNNSYWKSQRELHKKFNKSGTLKTKSKEPFISIALYYDNRGHNIGLARGLDYAEFKKACVALTSNKLSTPRNWYVDYIRYLEKCHQRHLGNKYRNMKHTSYRRYRHYDYGGYDDSDDSCADGYYYSDDARFEPYNRFSSSYDIDYFAGKELIDVSSLGFENFETLMREHFQTKGFKELQKEKSFIRIENEPLYLLILYLSKSGVSTSGIPLKGNTSTVPLAAPEMFPGENEKDLLFIGSTSITLLLESPSYLRLGLWIRRLKVVTKAGMLCENIHNFLSFFELAGFENAKDMFDTKIGPTPSAEMLAFLIFTSFGRYRGDTGKSIYDLRTLLGHAVCKRFKNEDHGKCPTSGSISECTCTKPFRITVSATPCKQSRPCNNNLTSSQFSSGSNTCTSNCMLCKFEVKVYLDKGFSSVCIEPTESFNNILKLLFPKLIHKNVEIGDVVALNPGPKSLQNIHQLPLSIYDNDSEYCPSSGEESEDEELEEPLKCSTHEKPTLITKGFIRKHISYCKQNYQNGHWVGFSTQMRRESVSQESKGLVYVNNGQQEKDVERSLCFTHPNLPLLETIEEKQSALEGRNLLLELHMKSIFDVSPNPENDTGILKNLNHYGYTQAKQPDSLAVALRDYQLQDLQFMLDAELGPGGLSRYFWAPVYNNENAQERVWWVSPFWGKFSSAPPPPLRGGFLCDEMGLGKTICTIGLILSNKATSSWLESNVFPQKQKQQSLVGRTKATLVVCHVSLVEQWIREATKMGNGSLKIMKYYGPKRKQDYESLRDNDVVVTTYQTLTSDCNKKGPGQKKIIGSSFVPPLQKLFWHRIVLDESHSLKNNSGRSKAVTCLYSQYKWCVTGTPINKSYDELYAQLNFLGVANILNMSLAKFLALEKSLKERILFSLMIRHEKRQAWFGNDLLPLPDKNERVIKVQFSPTELSSYQNLLQATIEKWKIMSNVSVLEVKSLLVDLRMATSMGPGNRAQIKASKTLWKKEKYENPNLSCSNLISNSSASSKKRKADSSNSGKKKKQKVSDYLGMSFWKEIKGGNFSKFTVIIKTLREDLQSDLENKVLIFTEFRETLELFSKLLSEKDINHVLLHGEMRMAERRVSLEIFRNDDNVKVFLASMRSAGVGINITTANKIYIVEPNENSSLENQAIGRCWRFGQSRTVTITRFVMENSIEEKVISLRDTQLNYFQSSKARNAYCHVGKYLGINVIPKRSLIGKTDETEF